MFSKRVNVWTFEEELNKSRIHNSRKTMKIERIISHGDAIFPKFFNLTLKGIFKKLEWSNKGIRINGQRLTNQRFVNSDKVTFA